MGIKNTVLPGCETVSKEDMVMSRAIASMSAVLFVGAAIATAGSYTEMGVNGYIGADWRHANPLPPENGGDPDAIINPIFRGWATAYRDYLPSDDEWSADWDDPNKALGPATGDNFDIVSLGDLNQDEIDQSVPPGEITLIFTNPEDPNNIGDPNYAIRDMKGYDFVVFGNGFVSNYTTGAGSVEGEMFSALGYVEVSSDGVHFARFAPVSLTPEPQGSQAYLTIEISDIYNFVGKHPNAYGLCVGTPFDLSEIADDPLVLSGDVDLDNISYVRIVDIPGNGDWSDRAVEHIDPQTWPSWDYYTANNPIYDAWVTWGSGGLDLEAVGVLQEQEYEADINLDGVVDMSDFSLFGLAWLSHFGQEHWNGRCDLAEPRDKVVDIHDLLILAEQWLEREQWRTP